jgi:hypothetical protein
MNDYAQQHERAWTAFIEADAREHPQPARPAWYVGLPWAFGPFLVIAISGILLSALRTAPVFAAIAEPLVGQSLAALEAVLALIVIEVSIVVIRFITVLHDAQDGRLDEARLRGWADAVKRIFDGGQGGLTNALKGKILKSDDGKFGPYPIRDIEMEVPSLGIYKVRFVLSANRFYQVTAVGPEEFTSGKDVARFMKSFKITKD